MPSTSSTPAASTINMFILNSLQTKRARKAKNIATRKLFRIKQIRISIRHSEEPPPGTTINIFVGCKNIRTGDSETENPDRIESRELVVWATHKSLAEAKSLFAPYAPKFQTVPCNEMTTLRKAIVSVLYLSNPE